MGKVDSGRASGASVIDAAGDAAAWMTLVHGMSHDHRYFSGQREYFRRSHRLLLVDLDGHGLSADAPGPFGQEEYAAGVLAAMDRAGVGRTHYLASHTGAAVGLLLASRDPGRFSSLMLEAPVIPGQAPPVVVGQLARARSTALERSMGAAVREWFETSPWFEVIRQHPEVCREAAHWRMVSEFSGGPWVDELSPKPVDFELETLAALTLPVLIINGEYDHPDFCAVSDQLEAILPNAQRAVIPGGGGFPAWEYPQSINECLNTFIQNPSRKN